MLIKFDDEEKKARVSLRAPEILSTLNEKELKDPT